MNIRNELQKLIIQFPLRCYVYFETPISIETIFGKLIKVRSIYRGVYTIDVSFGKQIWGLDEISEEGCKVLFDRLKNIYEDRSN